MAKIIALGYNLSELVNHINTAKTLAIISGILVSIVFVFSIGPIVQASTRFTFTFDYESQTK